MFDLYLLPAVFQLPQVIMHLLREPALRRCIEGDRQPHCHFRAYACMTVQQFGKGLAAILCRATAVF